MKNFNFLSNLLQRVSAMSGMRAETINYDGQSAANRRANMTSVLRHCKASDVRVARERLQKSSARVAQGLRKSVRFAATILVLLWIGVGSAWGTTARVTAYGNITSGNTYFIGATTSSTDYYLSVNGSSTSTSIAGTAVTSASSATPFVFSGSSTSWTIKFAAWDNYLSLKSSKDNGKVQVVSSAATFTLSNQSSKIRLTKGSYSVQKNNSGTQFGSYGNTQTDVWLEPALKVTYNANSATSGSVPTDGTYYLTGSTVTIKANSGSLARTGYTFAGWNTKTDGTGTTYTAGTGTFSISGNVTLYAKWESAAPAYTITAQSNNNSYGTVSLTGSTITATPAECCEYASPAYTVSPAGSATVSQVGNAFTVTPSANTTVTINFQEKSAGKTVNFDAGAGVCATTSLTEDCDGSGIVLPNVTASGVCKGWTTFAGWRTSAIATADSTTINPGTLYAAGSTYYPSSNGETLYAVFSKTKGGGTTPTKETLTFGTNYASNGSDLTSVTIYTGITATATEGTTNNPKFYTSSPGTWRMYSGSELTISSSIGNITKIEFTKSSDFNLSVKSGESGTLSSETWTYASGVSSITFNVGGTTKLSAIAVTYLAPSSTTYYCSDPNCCTQLGSINGSVSLTQLATPNPTKLKASWTMNAETGIASYTLKVYDSSDNLVKTINNYISGSEITGLTPCTTYYVELYTVSSSGSYCEGGLISTSSKTPAAGNTTHSYNVTFPTLTGTTKLTGNATACASGNYVATFEAANEAYELPTASGVTVTIGGSPATSGTDYTWAVSEGVGTLTIPTAKQTGDITIAVVSVAHSCSATPTLGAASLSGAFSLSSVGISCAGITPGSYCAVESGDYGFIWYEGTANDKKIGDTGVTKIAISTGDYSSGSFSTALSSTFVAGNTYTFRAFATNTGDNTGYSAESSFTPRSVTFNSNGGSAVATAYVNSGSAVSEPSAPTRTGYDFVKWQLNGADYSFSSPVNANITLDAVWDAKSYTVTFDRQSGSGGSASVLATYDAAMPSATMPTRSGYTFGGYYGSEGGAGTQYYAADGSSAHTWDVADAKTLYAQWTAKNYTITLNNEGADSGKGGTASISVTFDANTNLTSAITKPVRDGYQFGGYYTEEDGSGTQIIDENGNVKASVTSYTSATKQWIYAGNIELHAYWKPSYTVTWSVNGETTTEQVVSGEQVAALPAAPTSSDCDDAKVFVGWRSTAIDGVSAANPGSIFTTQAGSPAITGDVIFYAVFADESGGDFTRVTSTSQLVAGQKIIMGYEATANSGVIVPVQSGALNGTLLYTGTTEGSVGSGTLTLSSMSAGDETIYAYTLRAGYNSGYWAFEMSGDNAGKYLSHRGATNGKNSITSAESITSDGMTDFSIVVGTNDVATITNKWGNENTSKDGSNNYNYKIFCYNYSNGNPRAAIYRTTQTGGFVIYICNPLVYSNYVTSCSSCDADATFTNTTPAVSAIDCDAATLTMAGGLETLGADGCNVSDYGFVIGTTDNPAIGGVGVTKLQAGTTNPALGADFTQNATGLTAGTRYYIRAYATNRHGTAYSDSQNFWTKGVSSIAITTAPTKTKYVEGETFDKTGMVVTATMADGSTEDVTSDCTFSPSLSTKLSDETTVRATYSLCEVDETADQAINVYTLTVTEGTNDTYGTAGKTDNKVTVTGLGDHKTYTVTVTSGNADKIDNGDGTYTITNATGNVTVSVDYADAVQVKVYYKVDGVTVTGLTQDVYQSETTTLPNASDLATAMSLQGMDIPDDSYPNFVGWSETEFGAQTSEPTLVTGTPTINAEKTYYAVYTNLNKKQILPSNFAGSYATNEGAKTIDGLGYNIHDICLQSSKIQFRNTPGYLYSTSALSYIKKIEITGLDLIVNACSDNVGTLDGDAITPTGSDTYVYTFPASKQYFKIKGKGGTDQVSLIEIFYASSTVYYMTQFCTNRVTLTQNSPEHGTVEFGRSSLVTCGSDKEVSLTITPDVGYQLTGWTVNTSSGYADAKTTSPAVVTNSNNSAVQNITLTFAEDANKDYDVTATFGLMTVTSWTWTLNSAAIPDPLNLYVGQSARLDVAYTPAGVDASKKTYTRTKVDAYINWSGAAQTTYSTIIGRASTGESTTAVTFTHADGPTTTVNVKVLPLPLVHFTDNVHNVVFADVAGTIEDNAMVKDKTTPTTSDYSGTTYNTCEEQHEHLVGWIESSWADEHPNATHSEISGAGPGVFYTAGASIDVDAQNGKTFYAVWSKIE